MPTQRPRSLHWLASLLLSAAAIGLAPARACHLAGRRRMASRCRRWRRC